eukprot:TRINITY_DN19344_c0_g1_i1.p1 TRINITY_DN19344_c0_g1~~TRINITY_DN19344_c0_g1_i1.p1  ORF type:complete len:685 (-),score=108.37 TRINITY_DN19344_c0_g1_i1:533-2512(-)
MSHAVLSAGAAGRPAGCQYYAGENTQAPFTFYRHLANGSKAVVQAEVDNTSGLCVFPGATCKEEHYDFRCCDASTWVKDGSGTARGLNSTVCNVFMQALIISWVLYGRCRRKRQAQEEHDDEQGDEDEGKACLLRRCATCVQRNWKFVLGLLALVVVIALEVAVAVLLASLTQEKLSVTSRNALLATDSFLVPVREIFQFLEDAVTVKINVAIGAGRTQEVKPILSMGISGGAALGSVAAAIVTGICYWPAAIDWLVAPYSLVDAELHCSVSHAISDVVESAKPYILLRAWQWPFVFVNMALRGFLLGSGEWKGFVLLGIVEQGIALIGITCFFLHDPSLLVLGMITFIGSATATVFMLGMLRISSINQNGHGAWSPGEDGPVPVPDPDTEEELQDGEPVQVPAHAESEVMYKDHAIREGLYAMVLDLSVQMCRTIGIYAAGSRMGMGAMYQISTLESSFPQFGLQYIAGLTLAFRILGAQFVAQRQYLRFRRFFVVMVLAGGCIAVGGAITLLPYRDVLSFDLAQNACEFASEPGCLPIYVSIFGGGGSSVDDTALQNASFSAFVQALLAGLYACLDWSFMAKAAVICFTVVFIPSILVATLVIKRVTAVFVAMYLPVLVISAAFAWRIHHNIRRMIRELNDEEQSSSDDEGSSESSA